MMMILMVICYRFLNNEFWPEISFFKRQNLKIMCFSSTIYIDSRLNTLSYSILIPAIEVVTRASRTAGAKGSNSFARNNRCLITADHMDRIRLQVSANNK